MRTKQLNTAFESVTKTLLNFGENLEANQETVISLLRNMLSELEDLLLTMGLDEDQEKAIIKLIDSTIVSTQNAVDTTSANKQTFDNIIAILENLSERQQAMTSNSAKEKPNTDESNLDSLDDDVELF